MIDLLLCAAKSRPAGMVADAAGLLGIIAVLFGAAIALGW